MRCLTEKEVSEWLRERSITEDPYSAKSAPVYYVQFYPPSECHCLDTFVRNYYSLIIADSEAVVHMTDWRPYEPSEMIEIIAIRSSNEEYRWLIDAPGHLMTPDEAETGVAIFTLSASFAWSSYLYCAKQRSTLYNWEGDIFDFWTDCAATMKDMKSLLKRFKLIETAP